VGVTAEATEALVVEDPDPFLSSFFASLGRRIKCVGLMLYISVSPISIQSKLEKFNISLQSKLEKFNISLQTLSLQLLSLPYFTPNKHSVNEKL